MQFDTLEETLLLFLKDKPDTLNMLCWRTGVRANYVPGTLAYLEKLGKVESYFDNTNGVMYRIASK